MLLWKWKRRVRIVPQEASITKFQVGFLNQNQHPQTPLNLQCHTLPKTNPWQIFVELMWTELFRNSYFEIFCGATNRQQNEFAICRKLSLSCTNWRLCSVAVDLKPLTSNILICFTSQKYRNTKIKGKYIRCRFFSLQIWYSSVCHLILKTTFKQRLIFKNKFESLSLQCNG